MFSVEKRNHPLRSMEKLGDLSMMETKHMHSRIDNVNVSSDDAVTAMRKLFESYESSDASNDDSEDGAEKLDSPGSNHGARVDCEETLDFAHNEKKTQSALETALHDLSAEIAELTDNEPILYDDPYSVCLLLYKNLVLRRTNDSCIILKAGSGGPCVSTYGNGDLALDAAFLAKGVLERFSVAQLIGKLAKLARKHGALLPMMCNALHSNYNDANNVNVRSAKIMRYRALQRLYKRNQQRRTTPSAQLLYTDEKSDGAFTRRSAVQKAVGDSCDESDSSLHMTRHQATNELLDETSETNLKQRLMSFISPETIHSIKTDTYMCHATSQTYHQTTITTRLFSVRPPMWCGNSTSSKRIAYLYALLHYTAPHLGLAKPPPIVTIDD